MNDDVDTQDEATTGEAEGPVGGERLAVARREQQITVVEIAKELHLDEYKVRALERNEFDVLGAPVFAKGHLKKYAQLVGVKAADVMADYYHLSRAEAAPPVVPARPRIRQELSPGPWIAVVVAVILVVSAFWWFTRPIEVEPAGEQEAPQERLPETDGTDAAVVEPPPIDEEIIEIPGEPESGVSEDPEPAAATPAPTIEETTSPEIVPGQMRLLLTYTGDCWTEITDASGRRLFFALGKDGRSVELSGAEPFNVLFGNPGNVTVRVNGEEFALPPTSRPGRPLRLTITGS